VNSSKKVENIENEGNADSTSMYLRTPQDKNLNLSGGPTCENDFVNSAKKLLNSVSPFIQKK
jgi:hypothetical protein